MVRAVFATRDPDLAARRLVDFYDWVALVEVPELLRLATTLSRWQDEILAYHHTGGVSSARVEAINLDAAALVAAFDRLRALPVPAG